MGVTQILMALLLGVELEQQKHDLVKVAVEQDIMTTVEAQLAVSVCNHGELCARITWNTIALRNAPSSSDLNLLPDRNWVEIQLGRCVLRNNYLQTELLLRPDLRSEIYCEIVKNDHNHLVLTTMKSALDPLSRYMVNIRCELAELRDLVGVENYYNLDWLR